MCNEFMDLCRDRYSVRSFADTAVEEYKIDTILRAGQLAPTACNRQPVKIYLLKSKEALEKLQKCKFSHFGETLALIVCYDKSSCWVREFDQKESGEADASIVATHMMLAAWNLGIGSTWMMHFIPEAVSAEFSLPENIVPVCILVMGYPSRNAAPSPSHDARKSIAEMVTVL